MLDDCSSIKFSVNDDDSSKDLLVKRTDEYIFLNEKICKQKLVYNNTLDTTCIENILLICSKVVESELFLDSTNNNTFAIIYSQNSDKNELIELLRDKFKNGIKRIAFAFHDPLNESVYFLDNKAFFHENDLIENQTIFSENVIFLTNLIKEFNVINCDFLACNSLQYNNWKKYYELLKNITNVSCGASNDKTGNINYGADWVMENTNENIRDIYFTNSINNYTSSLATFTIDYVRYSTSGTNASVIGFSSPPNPWNLVIPSTVTDSGITYDVQTIGDFAFSFYSALLSVIIPNSVINISDFAFYNCSALTSVTIGNSVQTISDFAFAECSALKSTTIGNSVQTINYAAFYNCPALLSVTIPNSVINIGNYAFTRCSALKSTTIGNSVQTIGVFAFQLCSSLTSATIGNSVININYAAFAECSALTSVIIPNSVQTINDAVFIYCYALTSVTIGNSVTSIGTNTFQGCSALRSVYLLSPNSLNITVPTLNYGTFYGSPNSVNILLYVPISNICFPAGTLITCNQGNIPIEQLNPKVHTIRNKKIVCITKTRSVNDYLVCFEKHSLGNNVPSQKTVMTKDHMVFFNGKMKTANEFLKNSTGVYKVKYSGEQLYNVLMEEHDKMMVNNLICETLDPENPIAKLHILLQKHTPEQQALLIKEYNDFTIKSNNFSKKQLKQIM